MKLFITAGILLASLTAHATRYCNPEVSKPCGAGCISKDLVCRKPWTTSKVGISPNKNGKKGYANPQFVEVAPKSN